MKCKEDLNAIMKKSTLCIFANQFPYGKTEPYMEAEIEYWCMFEKIYIFALQLRKKNMAEIRKIPENAKVIPVPFNVVAYLLYAFVSLMDRNTYSELMMLAKARRLSFRSIAQLFTYISRSHYEASFIEKEIKNDKLENPVFYSYRFGYQPYVACLLKKKMNLECDIYARAHRYDLYEDRKKTEYIPMRRYLLKELKYCYPCSNDGTNYLKRCYPLYVDKIQTRYLGTVDHGNLKLKRGKIFKIVSCSNIVPVKRIDLIIRALALINNYKIEWTHFGSGSLERSIKKAAQEQLTDNIVIKWKGFITNTEVLKAYEQEQYNLFLNVSTSEGIPVSIMESGSFGIPCIATDAGGTRELIQNEINGILLPLDTTGEKIAESIVSFITMPEIEYDRYCKNAREIWKEKFSAKDNYQAFFEEVVKR